MSFLAGQRRPVGEDAGTGTRPGSANRPHAEPTRIEHLLRSDPVLDRQALEGGSDLTVRPCCSIDDDAFVRNVRSNETARGHEYVHG